MPDKELMKQIVDKSTREGDEPGFVFVLTCPSCAKPFQAPFVPFSKPSALASLPKFIKGADDPVLMAWNKEKAAAFMEAAENFDPHFTYCGKCEKYVCKKCWNGTRSMCLKCCEVIAAGAMSEALLQAQNLARGEDNCPKCGTVGKVGKFCAKCGTKIPAKDVCNKCNAKVPSTATFCPECGNKIEGR